MGPEHNPADDVQPTREEWEAWEEAQHLGEECHECEGTGEIVDDRDQEQTCPMCGGSGFAVQEPTEDE